MAQILREVVAGVPAEHLRGRAEQVLERIDTGRVRERGEDDEYDNMQEDPSTSFSMVSLWISKLLEAKGVHPTDIRLAVVSGFVLRIGARAALVPTPASQVHGLLMKLSHADIEKLYAEPSVRAYRPEPVPWRSA